MPKPPAPQHPSTQPTKRYAPPGFPAGYTAAQLSGLVMPYGDIFPQLADDVYVAPGAVVAGDVHIGAGSSVWFGTIMRGDVGWIRIGERTNLQDLSMVHVTGGNANTTIGDDVTVGHRAIIHGCTVEDRCLIGMGAILLDECVIGAGSVIAAGAVVPPGKVIPPGSMVMGIPGKVVRAVTDEQAMLGRLGAMHYVQSAKTYREQALALLNGDHATTLGVEQTNGE